MAVTGLRQVALRATDLDAAVAFYRDVLGLEVMARFDPPGLAFLRVGDTRLLLEAGAPPSLLYLEVDDLEAVWAQVVGRGVTAESEPHCIHVDTDGTFGRPGGEEWMAFLRDPDGNLVGLAQRRDP